MLLGVMLLTALAGAAQPESARTRAGRSGPADRASDLLAPLRTDVDALAELRQAAGPAGKRFETEHFLLVHTAEAWTARKLAARLETVYRANARFMRSLGIPPTRPEHKLGVLLFGSYAEFQRYRERLAPGDEAMLGFYEPANDRSVFFDLGTYPPVVELKTDLANLRRSDWAQQRQLRRELRRRTLALNAKVVQHEAAHQIHQDTGVLVPGCDAPTWLAEGLAQLFELPFVQRDATPELSANPYRLHELRELYGGRDDLLADLRRIVASEDGWRGGEDYALAWALTDYLYSSRRAQFAACLKSLAQERSSRGDSAEACPRLFEQCFGPLDGAFASQFQEHMRRLMARSPRSPD